MCGKIINIKKALMVCLMFVLSVITSRSDTTIVSTSFELTDTPPYFIGSIAGQNLWTIQGGIAEIVTVGNYVRNGTNGLKLFAENVALDIRHTPYSGTVSGISGIVYFDTYVKVLSCASYGFTICGYDLYGSSAKRTFVVEFAVPTNDTGAVNIFDGSTRTRIGKYQLNNWYRVSIKIDYTNAKYTVVFDGGNPRTVNFRETYTPTASGTRQANIKEYHQLRFNLGGGSYTAATGSVDAAVDQLYAGTRAPDGVDFGDIVYNFTVSVIQPLVGTITLNPPGPTYPQNTQVRAILTLPSGYKNYGWTGGLSGTELEKLFIVTSNMAISANVWIDSTNPPPLYTITVIQPKYGSITLSPPGPLIYAGLRDTATLIIPSGYKNYGWTGDLSGTELIKIFTVNGDMSFSANVDIDTTIPPGTRKTFNNASAFKTALANVIPGDTIELTDGTYDIGGVTITKSGTATRPILVRAQNRNMVELTGSSRFTLTQVEYIIIEGFVFTSNVSTAIKTEACNNIRITRNIFRLNETSSSKWVLIGGRYNIPTPNSHHNRIDHNLFENKSQPGNFIVIDGSPQSIDGIPNPYCAASQYDRIDHNHFRNSFPRIDNEKEAIRVGVSYMSMTSAYTVIEYNLFDSCDGDPEIISIKACDNTIRYNTFRGSQGTVCLRSGKRNTIEGNFFFGFGKSGTGGVRVYGENHKVFNNYFEGLTGTNWDAPITITNGDVDSNSTDYTAHFRPKNIVFCYNSLVNNLNNIEIGFTNNGSYSKVPTNITFANNLVIGSQNQLVKIITNPVNLIWIKNIMNPIGSATLGVSTSQEEISIVDPLLSNSNGIWKLSSSSPAIDNAIDIFPYVNFDVDGQYRSGLKDIGADEYSTLSIINYPLTPIDVGPNSTLEGSELPVRMSYFIGYFLNDSSVKLEWETLTEFNCAGFYVEKFNENLNDYETIIESFQPGAGYSLQPRKYVWIDDSPGRTTLKYRLKQVDTNGLLTYFGPIIIDFNLSNTSEIQIPQFKLYTNYPNPFNSNTLIKFIVPRTCQTTLKIYNIIGQELITLFDGVADAGRIYEYNLTTTSLSSGTYLCKLQSGSYYEIKKLLLLK